MTEPPKPLEERRRRALYRAKHRGTKEMDFLLGRYAEARLAAMDEPEMDEFEQFLALPDPSLQVWLMTGEGFDRSAFTPLIARIRAFHGLAEKVGAA
ncbi:MAG: succinate dehydrogenase assembly factor 2 [Hyphomicrobiaceae bacterium]